MGWGKERDDDDDDGDGKGREGVSFIYVPSVSQVRLSSHTQHVTAAQAVPQAFRLSADDMGEIVYKG